MLAVLQRVDCKDRISIYCCQTWLCLVVYFLAYLRCIQNRVQTFGSDTKDAAGTLWTQNDIILVFENPLQVRL